MDLRRLSPGTIVLLGYGSLIFLGTLLLLLPFSRNGNLSIIDALFTSTSAVCVTGLIVKDTATFYSFFGKFVILLLIQIGGLGYMIVTAFFFYLIGRIEPYVIHYSLREILRGIKPAEFREIIKSIVLITLIVEFLGVLLIVFAFSIKGSITLKKLGEAIFLSVSSFCNAGFSPYSNSLESYKNNPFLLIIISTLIVLGGIGYPVILYTINRFKSSFTRRERLLPSIHVIVVLWSTFFFIILGTLWMFFHDFIVYVKEYGFLKSMTMALFSSITPRTAGFNVIPISELGLTSILLNILYMFIGGAPMGTAGGIKLTTVVAVYMWVYSYLKYRERPRIGNRYIPQEAVNNAHLIFSLAVLTILVSFLLLCISERKLIYTIGVLPVFFELISAFGTVGLSYGSFQGVSVSLSFDFTFVGKSIIILTMLLGRIGILSLLNLIVVQRRPLAQTIDDTYLVG